MHFFFSQSHFYILKMFTEIEVLEQAKVCGRFSHQNFLEKQLQMRSAEAVLAEVKFLEVGQRLKKHSFIAHAIDKVVLTKPDFLFRGCKSESRFQNKIMIRNFIFFYAAIKIMSNNVLKFSYYLISPNISKWIPFNYKVQKIYKLSFDDY